jgi:hypothetical protein
MVKKNGSTKNPIPRPGSAPWRQGGLSTVEILRHPERVPANPRPDCGANADVSTAAAPLRKVRFLGEPQKETLSRPFNFISSLDHS